ncbi:MAG: AAA family ATPase, partial [Candidatus Omnitrophota bacterium]
MDFLQYWNLETKPFENTGDPKFFFYSPEHKEAMVRLIYVIRQSKAGALLAGDYGTGKTTIANELLYEIRESQTYKSVYISNPLLSPRELLQEIAYQLGKESDNLNRLQARRIIEEQLKDIAARGDRAIIIIDEAHLINRKDVLEELRLLMNMQQGHQFLATLIMMGQLEL